MGAFAACWLTRAAECRSWAPVVMLVFYAVPLLAKFMMPCSMLPLMGVCAGVPAIPAARGAGAQDQLRPRAARGDDERPPGGPPHPVLRGGCLQHHPPLLPAAHPVLALAHVAGGPGEKAAPPPACSIECHMILNCHRMIASVLPLTARVIKSNRSHQLKLQEEGNFVVQALADVAIRSGNMGCSISRPSQSEREAMTFAPRIGTGAPHFGPSCAREQTALSRCHELTRT